MNEWMMNNEWWMNDEWMNGLMNEWSMMEWNNEWMN